MIHTTHPARYYRIKMVLYLIGAVACESAMFMLLASDPWMGLAGGLWGLLMMIRVVQYARLAEEAERRA